ncbi:MAG: sigma-54-dependent Fis family transcriptional regulator [Gemmatimonadetes bacterium]|nr:sigma-54-dependent Fis family transcriptional regulator [Gemmatimonadota bacterium]
MDRSVEILPGMLGQHASMKAVCRLVRRVAGEMLPVMIVGETGTGKELVARALHSLGNHAGAPFIDINCAAVPETLAEGELFGWERGSFTGAHHARAGLLEAARDGTLFLDEINSMPVPLQAKLLRAIEQHDFRRVGGKERVASAFRLVSALSEPLDPLLASGKLRADFLFRIGGIVIELPPLRSRPNDIELLASHFLRAAQHEGLPAKQFANGALGILRRHHWPGNVRELRFVVERLALLAEGPVILAEEVLAALGNSFNAASDRARLQGLLETHRWNVKAAARAIGVSRATLYTRLKQFDLRRPASKIFTVLRQA